MQNSSITGLGAGRWIKQRRKELDLTQIELAERAGCSLDSLRKIEAGALRPSRQLAETLATGLMLPPDKVSAFVLFARTGDAGRFLGQPDSLSPDAAIPLLPDPLHAVQPPTNLPVPLSPFVGREPDVERINALLWRTGVRLITLAGPPGIGKTRLSLEVAVRALGDHPHGVFFVPLAPITEPDMVWSAVARVLDVQEAAGILLFDSLKRYLRARKMLLVFDNFEQVMDAAPDLVDLLSYAPGVKAIVTSREALRVRGEKAVNIPPMRLPDLQALPSTEQLAQVDSVALLLQRAGDVNADFALTPTNANVIAMICHKLDGLPLAIELAATHLAVLSPQGLLDRLESRLTLLEGGLRDLPPHQLTLRRAIDWSHDLLTPDEQILFRRLAIFKGGFRMEVAENICSADGLPTPVLKGISSLVTKSLVQHALDKSEEPRFGMLESIRDYALEQLLASGEADTLRGRHAGFFLELVKQAQPKLEGADQSTWLARLEDEHENLRSALDWWLHQAEGIDDADPNTFTAAEPALDMVSSLINFWSTRGHWSEGQAWITHALEKIDVGLEDALLLDILPASTLNAWSRALNCLGILMWHHSDFAGSRSVYERSLTIMRKLGDKLGMARALNNLGNAAQQLTDLDSAISYYRESLALARELGNDWGVALLLANIGTILQIQEAYDDARPFYQESLALRRLLDDKYGMAKCLNHLGSLALLQGNLSEAKVSLQESLTLCRELSDRHGTAWALQLLGEAARQTNDYKAARSLLFEALRLFHELEDRLNQAATLDTVARLLLDLDRPDRALHLLAAATAARDALRSPRVRVDHSHYQRDLDRSRRALEPVDREAAWSQGYSMTLEEAVAYALD